ARAPASPSTASANASGFSRITSAPSPPSTRSERRSADMKRNASALLVVVVVAVAAANTAWAAPPVALPPPPVVEAPPPPAPAPEPPKEPARKIERVAVYDLEVTDVEPRVARIVTDSVVAELRKLNGLSVVSMDEVRAMLQHESNKQLLGCTDASC